MTPTTRTITTTLTLAALGSAAAAVFAQQQPPPPQAPIGPVPTSPHPLLDQLDRESRALYSDIQGSVVRVVLPPPNWAKELAAKSNPLNKWGNQLDEGVRKKLEEHVKRTEEGEYHHVNAAVVTTQPTSNPATSAPAVGAPRTPPNAGGSVTVLAPVRVGQNIQFRPVTVTFASHIGIVLDTQGHVLVPLYVEREVVGDRKLPVTLATGQSVGATFVGSDPGMNVTLLRMDHPIGKPARLAQGRPADGSLVMLISPNAPDARLEVWTGGHQEMGLTVGTDGRFWGFSRFGHFLQVGNIRPEIEQLIQTGTVKRAQLGVWVLEVPPEDPLRERTPALGDRPAVRVVQVFPNTAAQRAGLQPDDLILTLAGQPVGDTTAFATAISRCAGDTELHILHAGQETTIHVELTRQ
jgi:hypothetical protein